MAKVWKNKIARIFSTIVCFERQRSRTLHRSRWTFALRKLKATHITKGFYLFGDWYGAFQTRVRLVSRMLKPLRWGQCIINVVKWKNSRGKKLRGCHGGAIPRIDWAVYAMKTLQNEVLLSHRAPAKRFAAVGGIRRGHWKISVFLSGELYIYVGWISLKENGNVHRHAHSRS